MRHFPAGLGLWISLWINYLHVHGPIAGARSTFPSIAALRFQKNQCEDATDTSPLCGTEPCNTFAYCYAVLAGMTFGTWDRHIFANRKA